MTTCLVGNFLKHKLYTNLTNFQKFDTPGTCNGKKIDLQVYFPHRFSPQKKIVPTEKIYLLMNHFCLKMGVRGFIWVGLGVCVLGKRGGFLHIYTAFVQTKNYTIYLLNDLCGTVVV